MKGPTSKERGFLPSAVATAAAWGRLCLDRPAGIGGAGLGLGSSGGGGRAAAGPRRLVAMYNVVVHGVAFMVIFSAFQTASEYAQPILNDQDLGDLGFQSAAVIYLSLAVANLAAPAVVERLGAKRSMIAGATLYLVYLSAFLRPTRATVLLASVVLGGGGAVLWAAQGVFLIDNSDPARRGRDSGIFWALLQCRLLIGNGVAYLTLGGGGATIAAADAHQFFVLLLVLGVVGVGVLFCLRPAPGRTGGGGGGQHPAGTLFRDGADGGESGGNASRTGTATRTTTAAAAVAPTTTTACASLRVVGALLRVPAVLRLFACFCYTGLVLTFWSGKYFSLMAGHVDADPAADLAPAADAMAAAGFGAQAVAVGGLCLGAGEILGGLSMGALGDKASVGRGAVFALAVACHVAAVGLSWLVFAAWPAAWAVPAGTGTGAGTAGGSGGGGGGARVWAGYAVGALLGFGDAGLNTAIYSLLGDFAKTVVARVMPTATAGAAVGAVGDTPINAAVAAGEGGHGAMTGQQQRQQQPRPPQPHHVGQSDPSKTETEGHEEEEEEEASAVPLVALFKLVQSSAAAVAFFYSGWLRLQWQIALILCFAAAGGAAFVQINRQVVVAAAVATAPGRGSGASQQYRRVGGEQAEDGEGEDDDDDDADWEAGRAERLQFLT